MLKQETSCFNCNGTLLTTKFDHVASVKGGEYVLHYRKGYYTTVTVE